LKTILVCDKIFASQKEDKMRGYKSKNIIKFVVLFLFFVGFSFSDSLEFGGDVQITCEPGLRIYLDGNFAGKSNTSEDGKYLSNLLPGIHTIRVEKAGFAPKTFRVKVISSKVIEIKVGKFMPEVKLPETKESDKETVARVTGSLIIYSAPITCKIHFLGETYSKDAPEKKLDYVPVGSHPIRFKRGQKELSSTVKIDEDQIREIKADFLNDKVIDITEAKEAERIRLAEKREAERIEREKAEEAEKMRFAEKREVERIEREKANRPMVVEFKISGELECKKHTDYMAKHEMRFFYIIIERKQDKRRILEKKICLTDEGFTSPELKPDSYLISADFHVVKTWREEFTGPRLKNEKNEIKRILVDRKPGTKYIVEISMGQSYPNNSIKIVKEIPDFIQIY